MVVMTKHAAESTLVPVCVSPDSGLKWFPPNSPSLELVSPLQVTHLPPVWDFLLSLA